MKAHLPPGAHLSAKERRELKEENDAIRRWIKLVCVVLHNEFGFGHDRIADFLGAVTKYSDERDHDEVFWSHVDSVIRDELGIDFQRENYEEVDK